MNNLKTDTIMEQNITVKTGDFFIAAVSYEKVVDDEVRRVKGSYAMSACCFTEAESLIIDKLGSDIEIADISKAPFGEVFFTGNPEAERFYKVKVNYLSVDERTGKTKKALVYYLVQASSTKDAQRNFDDTMKSSMMDYSIEAIIETRIVGVSI